MQADTCRTSGAVVVRPGGVGARLAKPLCDATTHRRAKPRTGSRLSATVNKHRENASMVAWEGLLGAK